MRVTPKLDTINSIVVKDGFGVERDPDIAFDGENYLVVWAQGIFGGEFEVVAARVTTDGVVVDSGIPFGGGALFEYKPTVDFDGDRYLAAWFNYSCTPNGVFGRFINTGCQPEGDVIAIRETDFDHYYVPDIAFANNYLVVWNEPRIQGSDDDVVGRLVAKDGNLIGDTITIATGVKNQLNPRITKIDSTFLVVWNQEGKIYGQWVNFDGVLIGDNFPISDSTSYDRSLPDIAIGANNCLAVWMEYRENGFDIYGNICPQVNVEEKNEIRPHSKYFATTIMNSDCFRLKPGQKLYDAMGRRVDGLRPGPGVYFVKQNKNIEYKLIIIQ